MDFQVVVLAGGNSKSLTPLVSKDVPKPLLPVANHPVLYYVLHQLEESNLKDLIVVVEGEDAGLLVGAWISGTFVDRLHVEIAAVPEDIGTAGALRAISHYLTAKDILVVSGDLVSDVSPGAVAATHRRHDAVVTATLCCVPISGSSESGSSGGKDKTKKPGRYNIIGLDPRKQFLLHIATGAEIEKDTRLQKHLLHAVGQMEIRSDLMDAHMYAFKRSVLQEVLDRKDTFQSLKQDVVPYLVRSQLKSEAVLSGIPQAEEDDNEKVSFPNNQVMVSEILANASTPSFHELYSMDPDGSAQTRKTHKCCAYIASSSSYCVRLNSIQAFMDINRDVTGEADHLLSDNVIGPSPKLGTKTTVGPHCMLGEGSEMGDKCQVKRSVIGRHCRIGSHVKVVNSVVMNHITIGDGCIIQGSVICSNVQLQEHVVLKDCRVGAGFVVTAGSEYKGESLARKEK
ncbi:translation initiation factor eIF-2B subunit gamma isoform X1 [Gossypium australe]|uniref:Translation initiation factor eIF2B subunit gamma n=1 Tax=Gossypium australe TaxID=47621 RepID=A0A5B6UF42_9ROSI|nr:translation initiation factor eIF-2B subunit gamma isoform X1 [Gossypium australe]